MLNKLQHMQQCASINSERPQAVLGSYSSATLLERNVSGKHNGRQTRQQLCYLCQQYATFMVIEQHSLQDRVIFFNKPCRNYEKYIIRGLGPVPLQSNTPAEQPPRTELMFHHEDSHLNAFVPHLRNENDTFTYSRGNKKCSYCNNKTCVQDGFLNMVKNPHTLF